jgi:membrane protease subunit HflK
LIEEANGSQAEVTQRAEGDASRFRQIQIEYAKAPAVTRERMYLDMMQTIVGNSSKVLVDQKAGSNSLLYLPLDKLIQQSAPAAATSGTADPSAARQSTPPPPEPTVTLDPARSREALRTRERGTESR